MNQEEVRQRLIDLALTEIECDKDGHGDCSRCEYRYADDECAKYYSGIMVDFFIANGVTIREHGEWKEETEYYDDEYSECNVRKVFACSVCGRTELRKQPYCNCGSDMRGVKDE